MKTAIYQFWDGKVRESCLAGVTNMKSYANYIGCDYLFEENPNWIKSQGINLGGYSAHFGAFKPVFDSAWDEYDAIMFADTDVFTVDSLNENVFEQFTGEIGICEEEFQPKQRTITTGRITSKSDEAWATAVKKFIPGADFPRTADGLIRVFNSGMVLYSRSGRTKAQKEFELFTDYAKAMKGLDSFYTSDQPYLHSMIFSKTFDVQIMDKSWNSYIHGTRDIHHKERYIVDHRTPYSNFVHCQFPGADNMNAEQLWKIVNLPREQWEYDI